mmetsp:Transcript_41169/g.87696  ORF Transcript_41169/g.87696 Transcript_41169/m.87696 type:complete len:275 (-) Transcript_41169:423-1247(-)
MVGTSMYMPASCPRAQAAVPSSPSLWASVTRACHRRGRSRSWIPAARTPEPARRCSQAFSTSRSPLAAPRAAARSAGAAQARGPWRGWCHGTFWHRPMPRFRASPTPIQRLCAGRGGPHRSEPWSNSSRLTSFACRRRRSIFLARSWVCRPASTAAPACDGRGTAPTAALWPGLWNASASCRSASSPMTSTCPRHQECTRRCTSRRQTCASAPGTPPWLWSCSPLAAPARRASWWRRRTWHGAMLTRMCASGSSRCCWRRCKASAPTPSLSAAT